MPEWTPSTPPSALARRPHGAVGWLCVSLAAIGAVLPVMPATVFLIAAVACFNKSSPETARKLLDHPRFGPTLRTWQERGAISEDVKLFAISVIAVSWSLLLVLSTAWIVPVAVGVILAAVAAFILTRPLPPDPLPLEGSG